MSYSILRIEMTAHGRGEVYLNDEKLPNVTAVKFSCGAGQLNVVDITLLADECLIAGPAEVISETADR